MFISHEKQYFRLKCFFIYKTRYNLFMSDEKERYLKVIETTKTETETKPMTGRQTNPIAKKFLNFHHKNEGKFSVKDLFRR